MVLLSIAAGGALGSVLRYLLGGVIQRASHWGFPYGTLAVNVIGCLLIGVLVQSFMNASPSYTTRGFLIVGFCGGFTTFSAFSVETIGLLQAGSYMRAALYVSATVAVCLIATTVGIAATRSLSH
jgi:CrcB protein